MFEFCVQTVETSTNFLVKSVRLSEFNKTNIQLAFCQCSITMRFPVEDPIIEHILKHQTDKCRLPTILHSFVSFGLPILMCFTHLAASVI